MSYFSKNNKNGCKDTINYWFMQQNVTKFCQNFHFANLTLQKRELDEVS